MDRRLDLIVDPTAPARWGRIAAAIGGACGTVGVVTWYTGTWPWLSFGTNYVPMSPLAGVLISLLAVALYRRTRSPRDRLAAVLAVIVLATSLGSLAAFSRADVLFVERWLVPTPPMIGLLPGGRIGPVTLASLILASLAALGPWFRVPGSEHYERLAALALVFVGAVFLEGYALGLPPLYGGQRVPPAALTALAVLAFGTALLFAGGADAWPLRVLLRGLRAGTSRRVALLEIGGLAAFPAAVLIVSGVSWRNAERDDAERDAAVRLESYVRLQSTALSEVYLQHIGTARALQALPKIGDEIQAVVAGNPASSAAMRSWLAAFQRERGYETAALFGRDGRALIGISRVAPEVIRARVDSALATKAVVVEDPHALPDGQVVFSMWVPLGRGERREAVLLMQLDAGRRLFAGLDAAATGFPAAEAWVFRRDGADALMLTDRRGIPGSALRLRSPGDSTHRVSSILMRDTVAKGLATDFRGTPVVFAGAPVPRTDWWLAASVPRLVLTSPLIPLVTRSVLVMLVMMAAGAALIGTIWSRRDLVAAEQALEVQSERVASADALRESEARLSRALATGSDGIWEWDIPAGNVFISENWRWMLGSPTDATAPIEAIRGLVHPDDRGYAVSVVARAVEAGEAFSIEIRIVPPDGESRWIWVRGETTQQEGGRPVRATGALSDIHARRIAEEGLRRTERMLRVLAASGAAVARSTTEDQLLQSVCDLAVNVGGYKMAWIGFAERDEGHRVRPVAVAGNDDGYIEIADVRWDDSPHGHGPTGRAIRTGEVQAAQNFATDAGIEPWRIAARERGFASSCAVPITVDNVVIGALMMYSGDHDAFDDAELNLAGQLGRDLGVAVAGLRARRTLDLTRDQLAIFRQVLDNSTDAVYIADEATGKLVDVNHRACMLLGYSREELLTMGPRDIDVDVGTPEQYAALVQRARRDGSLMVQNHHRRRDGSVIPVEIAVSVTDVGGRTFIVGQARDISDRIAAQAERETLQAQLVQAQKMEVVGRLAGGVAHDFNNMLAVIRGYADLLLAAKDTSDTQHEFLDEIRQAADRSAALTRQLLAFARLQVVTPVVTDPNSAIGNLLKMMRRVIGEDIQLAWQPGARVPPVMIDPTQLDQLLANIAVNARDAMTGAGTLTVTTSTEYVKAPPPLFPEAKPGEYVRIALTDTGSGMSPETIAHIFEPFFTTKAAGKGTGLGMSIVFGIASQNQGFVDITSAPGRGTTVSVYLPRADTAAADAEATEPEPPRGHELILLAEDEPTVRALTRAMLDRLGYRVLVAATPSAAIQLANSTKDPIHLLLTDVVMPECDGRALSEAIRVMRPGIHVLYMSGHTRDVLSSDGRLPEGTMFLQKPFTLSTLGFKVREAIEQPALA